jgi:putative DNA primase/helicase
MDYSNIKSHFRVKDEHGDKCKAMCPAHPDKEASLSISYDSKENKTLVFCHAGCETKDILDAVGLRISDLFDKEQVANTSNEKGKNIEAIYKYRDESGNVLFEKVRFRPKGFSQRRNVQGATVWGLDKGIYYETYPGSNQWSRNKRDNANSREFPECNPILYNLPELVQATNNNQEIFVVEGEKDAENLKKWGFVATCNPDGASKSSQNPKWNSEFNKYFKDAKVIILKDNDDAGAAHAENVALNLHETATYVKCPELTGLDEKGDISDWIQEGHTKEEFLELIRATEVWDKELHFSGSLLYFNFSDVGNAERLVSVYGKSVRYNPIRNKWMIWSGKHWAIDSFGKIEEYARKVIRKLQAEGNAIPKSYENEELKKQIGKFILKSETDGRIKAMISQAKTQRSLILTETDKDIYILNLKNGTLDLKTGQLKKHDRKDYVTRLVDVDYDIAAKCPNWTEFINKIFLGREDLINYIQKSVGYSLTGDANLQCFYILHGKGGNGKGTFIDVLMRLLGDYAGLLRGSSIMARVGDEGARGDLAKLEGARFVWINELGDGQTFDENLLKSLSSGASEAIPVRRLYEEEFDLHPQFKMWITTNGLPKIKGTDDGIWRRIRKIPFDYKFDGSEKDEHFFENKLLPELSGIMNWAIEGCLKWQQEGMDVPDIVKYAVEDYKNDMDPVQRFIDECCVISETCKVKRSDLYDAYCDWCKENKEYTLSSIKLNKKLTEKGMQEVKNRGVYYWKGMGLSTNDYDENLVPCEDNVSPFWPKN